ncbi:MAG: RNA polymerase sigma factor [Gemmatimonadota bacterium]|nr:RNA polymerase sigma factor [Gemmatimonadota bacterium]
MDDALLISRVLKGDRLAGRELYDAHAPRVFRLAYRMTSDDEMARECTQDAFVRVFAKLETFRQEAALSTWIHRIAVSTVLEAMRSTRRRTARLVDLDEARDVASVGDGYDSELAARLEKALDDLPEIYRAALIMHDLEGYTHAAIADALQIAEGTSKTRVAQARAKLRVVLGALRDQ